MSTTPEILPLFGDVSTAAGRAKDNKTTICLSAVRSKLVSAEKIAFMVAACEIWDVKVPAGKGS